MPVKSHYATWLQTLFWRRRLTKRQEHLARYLTDGRGTDAALMERELRLEFQKINPIRTALQGDVLYVVGRVLDASERLTDFGISPLFFAQCDRDGLTYAYPCSKLSDAEHELLRHLGNDYTLLGGNMAFISLRKLIASAFDTQGTPETSATGVVMS